MRTAAALDAAASSPASAARALSPPDGLALTAKDLIQQLDGAGIRKAALFSIAYQFGIPNRPQLEKERELVSRNPLAKPLGAARA